MANLATASIQNTGMRAYPEQRMVEQLRMALKSAGDPRKTIKTCKTITQKTQTGPLCVSRV